MSKCHDKSEDYYGKLLAVSVLLIIGLITGYFLRHNTKFDTYEPYYIHRIDTVYVPIDTTQTKWFLDRELIHACMEQNKKTSLVCRTLNRELQNADNNYRWDYSNLITTDP